MLRAENNGWDPGTPDPVWPSELLALALGTALKGPWPKNNFYLTLMGPSPKIALGPGIEPCPQGSQGTRGPGSDPFFFPPGL